MEEATNFVELSLGQKQILDDRLADYYNNIGDVAEFDKTLNDIEKTFCNV
jgi:hypothetical protein